MKFFAVFLRVALTAGVQVGLQGCQAYNSSSQDPQRFVTGTIEDQARAVIATRCAACHSFQTMTTASLISSGRITAKNPAASTLLTRIRGSDLGGMENMPPNDSVSVSDISTITNWIQSL